jgi:hypothetical protein
MRTMQCVQVAGTKPHPRGVMLTGNHNKFADQLVVATVHVPNDVERPMLVFQVVPKRLAHDADRRDLLALSV